VKRFLRSALVSVVVITLIVWLGTRTLMSHKQTTKKETTSSAISLVQTDPGSISEVVFNPNKHQVQVQLNDTSKFSVYYASDQAQADFQKLLLQKQVTFDSKGIGTSAWWTILTSLLPFVLLIGFWIFLMRSGRLPAVAGRQWRQWRQCSAFFPVTKPSAARRDGDYRRRQWGGKARSSPPGSPTRPSGV